VKTDAIFYSIFQSFPSIFFELIDRSPDTANEYEFASREIKQLALRQDGLFLPKNHDPTQPFYLVEVQFQPDETLYHRLFAELFVYLKQDRPQHPWQAVIIYPSRSVERIDEEQFGDLLALPRVRRIYLDELGEAATGSLVGTEIVKLVIESEEAAPERARQLIVQAREQLTDETVRDNLIDLIETIIIYKLTQKSREEIAAMLGLVSELKQTRFYQEVFEEGRLEGVEEGEQKAKQNAIAPLMELGLSLDVIARVLNFPLSEVEKTLARIQKQAEKTVAKFIELLTHQREWFSPKDLRQLEQLVDSLPNELEVLSQAISHWLERHPDIHEAHVQLMEAEDKETVGDGENVGGQPQIEVNKRVLQDAIALNG
jgi:predicted transposase/invertase (TIGR01784 family)